jgi:hypothetical protein
MNVFLGPHAWHGIGMDESSQLLPWMEMDPSKGHTHVHVVAREA